MIDTSFNSSMQKMMMDLILQLLAKEKNDSSVSSIKSSTSSSNGTDLTSEFSDLVSQISSKYGVDEDLVNSVIKAESNFNSDAVSSCGALGLMQLMPTTASGLGVTDALDPEQNIDGGVQYLKNMLNRYGGNIELALAAYNAGPGAVDSYDGIPPYQETQAYVSKIIGYYNDQK
jgi:soluble lytic murein transglycosylase-like protein